MRNLFLNTPAPQSQETKIAEIGKTFPPKWSLPPGLNFVAISSCKTMKISYLMSCAQGSNPTFGRSIAVKTCSKQTDLESRESMSKRVSVFGLGYVGSVTAACLAHTGNYILGVDVNAEKVATLEDGRSPILEPGLDEIVSTCRKACHLHATTDSEKAVLDTEISFVSVGTPSLRNGKLDLRGIESVCTEIGRALAKKTAFHWIVLRSTVLPGTLDQLVVPALERHSGKRAGVDFSACFIPEFLREGAAVSDFFEPPFTVLGSNDREHLQPLRELFSWSKSPIYETSPATAEMVKYVCNAFHAMKVGFVNEVGTLCKLLGGDTERVSEIFVSDTRLNISTAYLKPGFAFGGSCLPKDLRALNYRAKELDLRLPLLESLLPSNHEHIERAVEMVLRTNKRNIGMIGLSFKPDTDDLRESPLVHLVKRLLGEGCNIRIWDKNVALGRLIGSNRQFIDEYIPHIGSLLQEDFVDVVKHSEIVILGTKAVDKHALKRSMSDQQVLIDLVNLEKEARFNDHSHYEGICW
jgi:GDP-mannose 6-dehydrogenase